jgi:cation diffusion facilitator family transporter
MSKANCRLKVPIRRRTVLPVFSGYDGIAMSDCCQDKGCEIAALRSQHARVLWVVLSINATMFLIETIAGIAAHSTSLLADGLDMFGDATVYALTLFALSRSTRWQAGAALAKGVFMAAFGLAVLAEAGSKIIFPVMPSAQAMGVVGCVALVANIGCFVLLYRHRADNLNMSSTWVCSRNDVIANIGVLLAALAGALLASRWPDILVGDAIALLFLRSAVGVLRQASAALRVLPEVPVKQAARPVSIPIVSRSFVPDSEKS